MVPFGGSQLLVETLNQLNLGFNCLPESISRLFWYPGYVGRKLWGWKPCSIPNWSGYNKGMVFPCVLKPSQQAGDSVTSHSFCFVHDCRCQ